jgi:hypothetical protein
VEVNEFGFRVERETGTPLIDTGAPSIRKAGSAPQTGLTSVESPINAFSEEERKTPIKFDDIISANIVQKVMARIRESLEIAYLE